MIVQGIFGLAILGIFFPIMAAMQFFEKDQDLMCIPGEGLEERRNLGVCKSICSFCYFAETDFYWNEPRVPPSLCLKSTTGSLIVPLIN